MVLPARYPLRGDLHHHLDHSRVGARVDGLRSSRTLHAISFRRRCGTRSRNAHRASADQSCGSTLRAAGRSRLLVLVQAVTVRADAAVPRYIRRGHLLR